MGLKALPGVTPVIKLCNPKGTKKVEVGINAVIKAFNDGSWINYFSMGGDYNYLAIVYAYIHYWNGVSINGHDGSIDDDDYYQNFIKN